MTSTTEPKTSWGRRAAIAALAIGTVGAPFVMPGETAAALVAWLRGAGALGVLVYVLLYQPTWLL